MEVLSMLACNNISLTIPLVRGTSVKAFQYLLQKVYIIKTMFKYIYIYTNSSNDAAAKYNLFSIRLDNSIKFTKHSVSSCTGRNYIEEFLVTLFNENYTLKFIINNLHHRSIDIPSLLSFDESTCDRLNAKA